MMSAATEIKVKGTFSGTVNYSDGEVLDFTTAEIFIERNTVNRTLRIVAISDGAIILQFEDLPGETASVQVSRAEVEHKVYRYAVGDKGTVYELVNTDDELRCPAFSAQLQEHDKKDVTFTGYFNIDPSGAE